MAVHQLPAVDEFRHLLHRMLENAVAAKSSEGIEPALISADFGDPKMLMLSINGWGQTEDAKKTAQYAIVETAVRDVFNTLLAVENIEQSGFIQMWNLLDLVAVLADEEQCSPALLFWLVEELLDSQTIAGCRVVFDYLESRRERITKKHFGQKNMVILRACNELLRRLSRAEDTAFCGRVFIFMFQSFPLGDKSSVNLRGEYHVENVTIFDTTEAGIPDTDMMEVDSTTHKEVAEAVLETKAVPLGPSNGNRQNQESKQSSKTVSFDASKESSSAKPLTADELYPIFWSLQQSFSQPKRLFDRDNLVSFKQGLEVTMTVFETVQKEQAGRGAAKQSDDGRRGIKRKRGKTSDDVVTALNPKYLTSRDLFELEISDLSFRRHIAVQTLIILDLLLSLSPKAKEKQATITPQNKSVMYQEQILADEDIVWAVEKKRSIAEYLRQGFEGPFFLRMVETVLSRDKNWVRWKIENCPPIARPAVTTDEYLSAKSTIKRAATSKRLRPHPQASLDLNFLAEADSGDGMEKLKISRYTVPTLSDYQRKIADDDFEIEMPTNDDTKAQAIESKASKSWRALRIARKTKLAMFDKLEDPQKIDLIFEDTTEASTDNIQDNTAAVADNMPTDRLPLVISGPSGVGKGTLVQMLIDKHPNTFGKKASHTTRAPREGEVDGTHYYFTTTDNYDIMRDGDQFLEFNEFNGNGYGTSRKVVEDLIASGKIPVMEMDYHGIQQLKDQNYAARFIFLAAPSTEELERRLRSRGADTAEQIQQRLIIAAEEMKHAETEGFHDLTIVNDDLTTTYQELEAYIFAKHDGADKADVAAAAPAAVAAADGDVAMGGEPRIGDTA